MSGNLSDGGAGGDAEAAKAVWAQTFRGQNEKAGEIAAAAIVAHVASEDHTRPRGLHTLTFEWDAADGSGSGIQYDTLNSGGWLYAKTTGFNPTADADGDTHSIELVDPSGTSMRFHSISGTIKVDAGGGAPGSGGGSAEFGADGFTDYTPGGVGGGGGNARLSADGGDADTGGGGSTAEVSGSGGNGAAGDGGGGGYAGVVATGGGAEGAGHTAGGGGNAALIADGGQGFTGATDGGGGTVDITAVGDGGGNINLNASSRAFGDGNSGTIGNIAKTTFEQLDVGGVFEVRNHLGTVLLRVTEAGAYHIKTGASWVADL